MESETEARGHRPPTGQSLHSLVSSVKRYASKHTRTVADHLISKICFVNSKFEIESMQLAILASFFFTGKKYYGRNRVPNIKNQIKFEILVNRPSDFITNSLIT